MRLKAFFNIFFSFLLVVFPNAAGAQTTNLPLIQLPDLEYQGAFRLPRGENGDPNGFSFGGNSLAYNKANNSLFVTTKDSGIAEVSIPTPSKNSNIEELPFSVIIQKINMNPTEGGLSVLEGSSIRGLLVEGDKIYGTASIYYDASNSARVSHFSRSTNLSTKSATPFKSVWRPEKSGFVGGWLAQIPSEWQLLLGGDVLSGNCCVPIVTRTSFGPSAFAWKISDYEKFTSIPATPLLYYPSDHPTLGPWGGSNSIYGGTTVIGGMVIPAGTRSLLYFGMNGTGEYCYGTGGASGGECVDPLSSDKGQHAYPYNHQVWAYDLNDLISVKNGDKNPWEVKPYTTWTIKDFPVVSVLGVGGIAYDEDNQVIYISQVRADKDGYSARSLIHVYKVKSPLIKEETPAPILSISRNLFLGVRGADVVALQNYLIQKGYLKANPTGYFGVLTRSAVRAFQRAVGLPSTGYFGPMSRALINK